VNRLWSFFGPLVTFLTECGGLVIWGCGVWLIVRGDVRVAVLLQFVAYIGRFYTRLESMSRILASTQRAGAAAHRIFEILDRQPSVPEPLSPRDPGRLAGAVELQGVRFRYGKREVLHGIDLRIEPGEMIGLVGASGAGKSTLVNLVCRFYDVSQRGRRRHPRIPRGGVSPQHRNRAAGAVSLLRHHRGKHRLWTP
jgi:ATP-binding cassette subfamily B protein